MAGKVTKDDFILRMFKVELKNERNVGNCIIPNTRTGKNEAMERSNVGNFLSV